MSDRRGKAGAIVHLHTSHATAVSCMAGPNPSNVLPPLTAYYVMRISTLPLIPYFAPGDLDLAGAVREMASDHHAVRLANHGPVVAGLGYFSRFHLEAWQVQSGVQITGVCDSDPARVTDRAAGLGVAGDTDLTALLAKVPAQIVDIVAPPPAHDALVRAALAPGRVIVCQKPFCISIPQATALVQAAEQVGAQIVIHENFRFQPWYRQVRDLLEDGTIGPVYQARFALRPGDGRGPEAYMARQPAFRTMPRLLIHETGVHFIDLFRWLLGEVETVYADLRRLNPAIAGEDAGVLIMTHAGGAQSIFDGNRLSDHVADNPRRTMGEFLLEGEGGALRVNGQGQILLRPFGTQHWQTLPLTRSMDPDSFGGGCVAALIEHVAQACRQGEGFENLAQAYLPVMQLADLAYRSDAEGRRLSVGSEEEA